jgi:hypothetical protein
MTYYRLDFGTEQCVAILVVTQLFEFQHQGAASFHPSGEALEGSRGAAFGGIHQSQLGLGVCTGAEFNFFIHNLIHNQCFIFL